MRAARASGSAGGGLRPAVAYGASGVACGYSCVAADRAEICHNDDGGQIEDSLMCQQAGQDEAGFTLQNAAHE
jgi:hypothetical protein